MADSVADRPSPTSRERVVCRCWTRTRRIVVLRTLWKKDCLASRREDEMQLVALRVAAPAAAPFLVFPGAVPGFCLNRITNHLTARDDVEAARSTARVRGSGTVPTLADTGEDGRAGNRRRRGTCHSDTVSVLDVCSPLTLTPPSRTRDSSPLLITAATCVLGAGYRTREHRDIATQERIFSRITVTPTSAPAPGRSACDTRHEDVDQKTSLNRQDPVRAT